METEGNVCVPFGVMTITIKLSFDTSNFVTKTDQKHTHTDFACNTVHESTFTM
jgi:hypothetical protein